MTVTATAGARRQAPARSKRPTLRAAARFGDFTVACVEHRQAWRGSDAQVFDRGAETARVLIVLGGQITVASCGAQDTLTARDAVLLRPGFAVEYASAGPARVLVCDLPASQPGVTAMPESMPYAVGRASSAMPSALAAFLLELLRQDVRGISREGRREAAQALTTMVSSLVTTLAVAGSARWKPEQRRQAALQIIAAHFMDATLTSESVAHRLGLSRRTLQRLFEDGGQSVAQHIQAVRAQHAVARLRDPRFAHATLQDIATLSGFGSVVALRRAVVKATGLAPSALRERATPTAVA